MNGLVVSLDKELKTVRRVWVVAEIGQALEMEIPVTYKGEIASCYFACDIEFPRVEECEATDKKDKRRILKHIQDTVGTRKFNEDVSKSIFHGVRVVHIGHRMQQFVHNHVVDVRGNNVTHVVNGGIGKRIAEARNICEHKVSNSSPSDPHGYALSIQNCFDMLQFHRIVAGLFDIGVPVTIHEMASPAFRFFLDVEAN
ncbi:unnamed protein product [Prorocentrum cordatum]|uniref:Uncharacterized protein n=1 Tax=Prorocentrum cordatum TaxID=2364126 RepID=A0ABN9TFB7_9DINO|nr:unnamed protein product [Polarella glacialis]